jgi:RNA 2',3'-cyclic 3'-phosphodiesterase
MIRIEPSSGADPMPSKTCHSAVAIVPPDEVWEPIQAIRRRYDRQIDRWMPHINLLYSFRSRDDFPKVQPALVAACRTIQPFTPRLAEFRFFRHPSGRCTLWLAPEPAEELRRLQAVLQNVCPDCDDLSRFPAGFTPHLSVGQLPSLDACNEFQKQIQANWQPIAFAVVDVALLARTQDGPFSIKQ